MNKNKEEKAQKKFIAQKLKDYMQNRYASILAYLMSDTADAAKNVDALIRYEPHFYKTIQQINEDRNFAEQERIFYEYVNMEVEDSERYLEDARLQIILVREELGRVQSMRALAPRAIKYKNGRIAHLQKRLKTLEITEKRLAALVAEQQPVKRKPGRPKKTQENIIEVTEYEQVECNENSDDKTADTEENGE